ncbi:MAG: endolytic transglycosylase MltG, partial [Oscillospiraceae bacterium]|nr:endolytic transglycosylase MltG [Oscillospiraceae bacterium]
QRTQAQPQREYNEPRKRKSQKQVSYRWFRAILMVIATVVGCVFIALFILDSAQDLFGLNQPDIVIEINIPEGSSNREVAQILADKGIITKLSTFMIYSGLKTEEGDFKSGDYIFNTNMGYDQLISAMKNKTVQKEVVTITFIEGRTVQEIAKQLDEKDVCGEEDFLEYLQTGEFDYEFMDRLPDDDLRFRKLEGYIFPDTYDFYVGEKVESVAAKFLANFQRKMTDEMETRMTNLNLTMDEMITLASIIQKEAGDPDEMKLVSSVFHNRLRNAEIYPKLQSDVTIYYVNNFIEKQLNVVNQTLYDAYNTYVCDGLPVGPICNPGMDAIEAALNPEDTEDYFFVTDVNGKYYYAKTAEDHEQNVRTARAQKSEDGSEGEIHGIDVQGNE